MKMLFLRATFAMTLFLAAATAPVQALAAPVSEQDAKQVQIVIVSQLQAFAEDDADSAFATATPGVRAAIGNPGRFLAMVRGQYPMVYRPATVSFLKPEEDSGTVMQLVQITDGDDKEWLALFALERQPDSTWRISGCIVTANPWRSA